MDLSGKVAVVTGSGQGLGLAFAQALAAAGAAVVVNDVDEANAEKAVASIIEGGGRAVAEVAAVGSAETAAALVQRAADEFGRLHIMVTNAGILWDKVLWKHDRRRLRRGDSGAPAGHVHLRARGGPALPGGRRGWPADPRRLAGRCARQLRARPATPPPSRGSRPWRALGRWSAPRRRSRSTP